MFSHSPSPATRRRINFFLSPPDDNLSIINLYNFFLNLTSLDYVRLGGKMEEVYYYWAT